MKQDGTARSLWPRILGYFLGAMLLLTLFSRAADSIMLPVVKCERPFPGALKHTVALSGVIEAQEQWPVMAEPGLAVSRIYVRAGQSVQAGDALLSYDVEALQRKLDEKQAALKKLTLQAQVDAMPESSPEASATPVPQDHQAGKDTTALKQQISRIDIDLAQREADRLSQLLYGGATLTAPADGMISELIAKPGDTVSGAALLLSPTSSELVVRVAVTEEQKKHLQPGTEASYQRSGETQRGDGAAVLLGISPAKTGHAATFELPANAGSIGQTIGITATQNTETYPMRVPLGAIVNRGGIQGVYRVRTGQSVLGNMEYAEFVRVEVIEADQQYGAINASLSDQDQVVVSMSKPVNADDRVRSSP